MLDTSRSSTACEVFGRPARRGGDHKSRTMTKKAFAPRRIRFEPRAPPCQSVPESSAPRFARLAQCARSTPALRRRATDRPSGETPARAREGVGSRPHRVRHSGPMPPAYERAQGVAPTEGRSQAEARTEARLVAAVRGVHTIRAEHVPDSRTAPQRTVAAVRESVAPLRRRIARNAPTLPRQSARPPRKLQSVKSDHHRIQDEPCHLPLSEYANGLGRAPSTPDDAQLADFSVDPQRRRRGDER